MKLTAVLTAVVASAAITATAGASSQHLKWHDMTLTEKRAVVQHEIHVHRSAVRWWFRHRQRYPASSAAPFVKCDALGASVPGAICVHGQRLMHALHVREHIDERIAAREAALVASSFPPHHALWECIARFESGGDPFNKHNPSYRGYLQMSYGWLGLISGDPADHSQAQQEWAAETGYQQNDYSPSFLYGQWFNYDGAAGTCLRYA